MYLTSPHLPTDRVPATRETIASIIPDLVGKSDPFVILSTDDDEMTYAQALWEGFGFSLDYQEGRLDRHYRTVRHDLTAAKVVAALRGYLEQDPAWRDGLEFESVELRSTAYLAGYQLGRLLGKLRRVLRYIGI